jgi:hypothetical protein
MPAPSLQPFFRERGWKPFPFQKETWAAYAAGKSGLLHAPTEADPKIRPGKG